MNRGNKNEAQKTFRGVLAVCVLAALIVGFGRIGHLDYMELRQ